LNSSSGCGGAVLLGKPLVAFLSFALCLRQIHLTDIDEFMTVWTTLHGPALGRRKGGCLATVLAGGLDLLALPS
jgi:hypothetical protein